MKKIILVGIGALLALGACKPTEKNYREAYEAALNKQQKEQYDADLGLDKTRLRSDGDPYIIRVGNDSVYYIKEHLVGLDETLDTVRQFNVAVARYKMPTNVKAQASDLRSAGYESYVLRNGEPYYFVMVAGFDSLPHAVRFVKEYEKKHPKANYIGQPAPVIHEAIRFPRINRNLPK